MMESSGVAVHLSEAQRIYFYENMECIGCCTYTTVNKVKKTEPNMCVQMEMLPPQMNICNG